LQTHQVFVGFQENILGEVLGIHPRSRPIVQHTENLRLEMVDQAMKGRVVPGPGCFNQFDNPILAWCRPLLIGWVRILHAAFLADLQGACPCQCRIHVGTGLWQCLVFDHFRLIMALSVIQRVAATAIFLSPGADEKASVCKTHGRLD
jgi:hypothetical protein